MRQRPERGRDQSDEGDRAPAKSRREAAGGSAAPHSRSPTAVAPTQTGMIGVAGPEEEGPSPLGPRSFPGAPPPRALVVRMGQRK